MQFQLVSHGVGSLKDNLSYLPNLVNVYVKAIFKLSCDWDL